MATTVGTSIKRAIDAVGTSSRCWIPAATTSTRHTSLAPKSRTMDAANAMGTPSRRPVDAVGNTIDAVRASGRRARSGVICIFSNYRLKIKKFNIMQVLSNIGFLDHIVPNLEFMLYFMSFMII
jgi:hypothetical protein